MRRPWMPPEILTDVGPTSVYGYDGKIHLERASPAQWRSFRLEQARARGTHTPAEWVSLCSRIGCCVGCGRSDVPLTKDHIIPISRGGCDCVYNLQPLCAPCNSSKCDALAECVI